MPKPGSASAVVRMVDASTSGVSARATSASAMCTVASATLSRSAWKNITGRATPVRWPSRSVCPFHGRPASANASLFTGAVAMASMRKVRASATAATIAS